ncbi:hypothetical protein [Edaphocola flava]|uniref:hypothetical protein n=1 Tax=Edaphocola flava TaxID=2499629 RepID=UPI00100A5286|nr:hypothetical protein [Edaphocola flava]
MKKVMMILAIAFSLIGTTTTQAQAKLQVNIGNQPGWGPTGYDHVDFYYLPELNCYYDVIRGQFIVLTNNAWIYSNTVPSRYRGIDLYRTYKVVVNNPRPYQYNASHIRQYARYKTDHTQVVIRNSKEYKYYQSAGHPNHNQWKGNNGWAGNNRQGQGYQNRNNSNHNTVRTNPGTTRGNTQQSVRTNDNRNNGNRR